MKKINKIQKLKRNEKKCKKSPKSRFFLSHSNQNFIHNNPFSSE